MASLEQTLAAILRQIEEARGTGDESALGMLMQRKAAICEMLCALEQR